MGYKYKTVILKNHDMEASYIVFPYDLKNEFGKGRIKVEALLDNVVYNGSIVNMGLKNADGTICYIMGIPKEVRKKLDKTYGEEINVIINVRD